MSEIVNGICERCGAFKSRRGGMVVEVYEVEQKLTDGLWRARDEQTYGLASLRTTES